MQTSSRESHHPVNIESSHLSLVVLPRAVSLLDPFYFAFAPDGTCDVTRSQEESTREKTWSRHHHIVHGGGSERLLTVACVPPKSAARSFASHQLDKDI